MNPTNNVSNITFDQLIECIQQSKREVKVITDDDYFGETLTEYVSVIDSSLLIGALQDAEAEAVFAEKYPKQHRDR